MKKTLSVLLSAFICLALLAGCGGDRGAGQSAEGDTQLNIYTWEGMFPQEVLDAFEDEFGIKINYSNFDAGETMLTKLQQNGGSEYDLVIVDDYIIETIVAEGLAQKLDVSKIENFSNINPTYQKQYFDPNNEYTVPYGAGVQTIAYNPAIVKSTITSYEDLWDPEFEDNLGIIANFRVINGMALKVNGESYNTNDLAKIQAAGDRLLGLAPNIRLIKDDNLQDDLLSGEIAAAIMYTGQVTIAMMSNPNIKIAFPAEGIGFGIMAGFIPSQAPHAQAAHKFLDYILRPEVSADCFEWIGYYCTNKAADALISEDMRGFLTLPADFSGNMEMIGNVSPEAEDLHAKIWTEFKTACGQ